MMVNIRFAGYSMTIPMDIAVKNALILLELNKMEYSVIINLLLIVLAFIAMMANLVPLLLFVIALILVGIADQIRKLEKK